MTRFFQGRADADIESQLRANRPEPRPEVLDEVVSRIVGVRDAARRRPAKRHLVAIAGIIGLVAALASFGALSSAQKSARNTASATADAAVRIVSKPTSKSADTAVKGANTLPTSSSGATAVSTKQASSLAGAGIAPTAPRGNVATQTGSAGLSDPTGLDLPSLRFLAVLGTYAANQWICHYKGGNKNAPGQWDIIQLTDLAIYTAHASHPDDTGPYATQPPDKQFCVDHQ